MPEIIFIGVIVFAGLVMIISGFLAFLRSLSLYGHLKKENYTRWRELTTLGPFGPGAQNSVRGLRYIYNDLDCTDPRIFRLKDSIRKNIRAFIAMLITMLLNMAIVILLSRS